MLSGLPSLPAMGPSLLLLLHSSCPKLPCCLVCPLPLSALWGAASRPGRSVPQAPSTLWELRHSNGTNGIAKMQAPRAQGALLLSMSPRSPAPVGSQGPCYLTGHVTVSQLRVRPAPSSRRPLLGSSAGGGGIGRRPGPGMPGLRPWRWTSCT